MRHAARRQRRDPGTASADSPWRETSPRRGTEPPRVLRRLRETRAGSLGVVAAHRGEGPSSGLVAGDACSVCLGAGMALWDAGCACGDTHRAGRGIPAPTSPAAAPTATPPDRFRAALASGAHADAARTARLGTRTRDPAPLGGPSEKPDAGHTTDCVIPARRATRRVQRHALGRVARLICKVIRD